MNTPNPIAFQHGLSGDLFWSLRQLSKNQTLWDQLVPAGTWAPHSHSIVPGGFDVMSYTTRLTPFTSLMMRVAVSPKNFISNG
jgi:hypothetical protein